MKNVFRLIGFIALAAAAAFTMTACPEGEGPNTDPKILVITQLTDRQVTASTTYAEITVFPVGTSIEDVLDKTGITAWGESNINENTFKNSLTVSLYNYEKENGPTDRWTGYGNHDVYVEFTHAGTYTLYKAGVSFSEETTIISINSFNFPRIEKTLIIENVPLDKIPANHNYILVAISTAGASPAEVANLTKVVAAAGGQSRKGLKITGSGNNRTITAQLYVVANKAFTNDRWTDSGVFDLWLVSAPNVGETGQGVGIGSIGFSTRSTYTIDLSKNTIGDPVGTEP